jgi:ABC-type sugar transport system permease subunit
MTPSAATAQTTVPRRRRVDRRKVTGLLLISPWLVGLLLFKLLPILASLGLSFTDFHMLTPGETRFVGLDNYVRLLHDEAVGYVLFETIALALTTIPLQLVASIGLAAILNSRRLRWPGFLRTMFFVPSIIPSVAILFMWIGFLDPNTGWLNRFILEPLGLMGAGGIYSDAAQRLVLSLNSLWAIGPGMLIMLGAMQSVPREIEESARVDGAGPFYRFFAMTLPMISPAIFFALVINLITVFGGVLLLDRGNIFSGSESPVDGYISYQMFQQFDLGYATTLAWVLLLLVMGVILFLFSTSRRWVYYADAGD